MNKTITSLCALWLTACNPNVIKPATPPEVTVVKVPAKADCLGEVPKRPVFVTDAELLAMSDADFIQALNIDRIQRDIYTIKLETAMIGCE